MSPAASKCPWVWVFVYKYLLRNECLTLKPNCYCWPLVIKTCSLVSRAPWNLIVKWDSSWDGSYYFWNIKQAKKLWKFFKWSQDRGFNLFLVLVGLWSHVETSRLILRDASDETQISGHQRSEKFRLISVLGSFAQFWSSQFIIYRLASTLGLEFLKVKSLLWKFG